MIRLVREANRTCSACGETKTVTLYALDAGGQSYRCCDRCADLAEHGRKQLVRGDCDVITLFKPIPWGGA